MLINVNKGKTSATLLYWYVILGFTHQNKHPLNILVFKKIKIKKIDSQSISLPEFTPLVASELKFEPGNLASPSFLLNTML